MSLSSAISTRVPAMEGSSSASAGTACTAPSGSGRRESTIVKVVPSPCRLTKEMVPPICSTSSLAMGNPRPVPL